MILKNYIICVLCFVSGHGLMLKQVWVAVTAACGENLFWSRPPLLYWVTTTTTSQHGPRAESGIANNLHGECRDCRDCRVSRPGLGRVIPDPICWNKLILSASSFLSDPSRWFSYMPRPGYRLYALCFDIKLHIYLTSLKHWPRIDLDSWMLSRADSIYLVEATVLLTWWQSHRSHNL